MIAELELERIKESWATAITRAVDRGIHISSRPPTGYVRAEVFRRRVLGASWAELADYLEAQGVETPRGNAHWSKTGVSGLVKNHAYLGQARSGSIVKEGAHEALVKSSTSSSPTRSSSPRSARRGSSMASRRGNASSMKHARPSPCCGRRARSQTSSLTATS